jgi:hypothetical protein
LFETLIPNRVPIQIVHLFETVEVQTDNGCPMATFLRCSQSLAHALLQQESIRQPGQSIVMGQFQEVCLQVPTFGDILRNHKHSLSSAEADVVCSDLHLNLRAVLFDVSPGSVRIRITAGKKVLNSWLFLW